MAKIIKNNNRSFDPDDMPILLARMWKGKRDKSIVAGINEDDCAVLKIGSEELVISTDYLNANPIAVEFGIGSYKDLGRLLVASNLSDLCGSGAKPISFLASIMLRKGTARKQNFVELMRGIRLELSKHGVPLVGGDTKLGNSDCFCGIAVGIKEKGTKLFLKNGAKPGDSIWLSGNIGSVAAAIEGLRDNSMETGWNNWARNRIVRPKIPLTLSRKIARTMLVKAGTDLSDGLGSDLANLCDASKVGAVIFAEEIPVSNRVKEIAVRKGIPAWYYAFTIGGDFQFIITANGRHDKDMKNLGLYKIGNTTIKRQRVIVTASATISMPNIGHRDASSTSFQREIADMVSKLKILAK